MQRRIGLAAAILHVALVCPAVRAVDGVIEINQATVEGDGGFPYVISEPGSYILTGNLSVPGNNTTAIEVRADDVTLDLNGFAIQCSESDGVSCEPSFQGGEGVTAFFVSGENSDNAGNTVVRNGTIRRMGFHGVNIDSGLVEGIQALENGGFGIRVGAGGVTDCLARSNSSKGIGIGKGVATTNIAVLNGTDGIAVREGVAQNNVSESNGASGIKSEGSALILGNRVTGNSGDALNLDSETGGVSGYADNVVEGVVTLGQAIGCNLIDGSQICPNPPSNLPFNTR